MLVGRAVGRRTSLERFGTLRETREMQIDVRSVAAKRRA